MLGYEEKKSLTS